MCDSCDWQQYAEDMEEAIQMGLSSQFVESVLDFAKGNEHITDRQKAGVDRWLDNWRERQERGDR